MTFNGLVLREARRQPGRTLLTMLGIVIGVHAVVAIPITIETTRGAYRSLFEGVTGRAALEVVAVGQGGFEPGVAERLKSVSGVAAVVPTVQFAAALQTSSGATPVLLIGIDEGLSGTLAEYSLQSGRDLHAGGLLLQAEFARSAGIEVGSTIRLLAPAGLRALEVTGLVEPRAAGAINAAGLAYLPLATAQELAGSPGRINNIQLVLDDEVPAEQVRPAVAALLPVGLLVREPAARAALAGRTLANTEQLLATLSVVALAAGAFVILNSFLMSVGERRRELAILRSLGATRRQIAGLLLREAAWLGGLGTVAGIPLGILSAQLMMSVMEQMMAIAMPAPRVTPGPIIFAALLGPTVALLSAWWPARQAAGRPPLEVLCERPGSAALRPRGALRWTLYAALGLLAVEALALTAIFRHQVSKDLYVYVLPAGMVLGVLACAALIPWIVQPLLRLSASLLVPLLGVEAGLAVRQLRRHPGRTALVVGVLAVSILVAIGFGQVIIMSVDDVHDWCDRVIASDFLVRAHLPEPSTLLTGAMPEALAEDIAGLPGVKHAGKLAFIPARAAGLDVIVLARTWTVDEPLGIDLIAGEPETVRARLLAGEVVIGSHLALQAELDIGDVLPLETRDGLRQLPVAGMATEYTGGGTVLYASWPLMKELLQPVGVHDFLVDAAQGRRAEVEERLRAFCREHGLVLQSRAQFRASLDEMMAGVLGSFWALLGLVFIVASLGVTNAVTMNVREQTRELGILRAVAMRRRQVCKMVLSQALALGAVSLLPGAVGGVLLSLLVTASTYPITGLVYDYRFSPVFLGGCLLLALVIAAAASIPPLIRVARLSVVEALQYE